jgi:thiol:disulfide interchange protein DsbA
MTMRLLNFICLMAILLGLWTNLAYASPANPVEDAEYKILSTSQSVTAAGKKIEVIEFFMYHCSTCHELAPQLADWVNKQGDNIAFRRLHVPPSDQQDAQTHLFLTLEALGKEDAMYSKVMRYWHIEHHELSTDQDNIEWAANHGLDKTQFTDAYFSFSVMSKLQSATRLAKNYQISSTPSLVIDGRFLTSPELIQNSNKTLNAEELNKALLQVADVLVEKAKAER